MFEEDWERWKAAPLWERCRAVALIVLGDALFILGGWVLL